MTAKAPSDVDSATAVRVRASFRRFAYTYAILLVVLPALLAMVFGNYLYSFWFDHFERPAFEMHFGFILERREIITGSGHPYTMPVFTSVTPGGRFERLGVRQGDVLVCDDRGLTGFYSQISHARDGYEMSFRILASDQLHSADEHALAAPQPGVNCTGGREVRIGGKPL